MMRMRFTGSSPVQKRTGERQGSIGNRRHPSCPSTFRTPGSHPPGDDHRQPGQAAAQQREKTAPSAWQQPAAITEKGHPLPVHPGTVLRASTAAAASRPRRGRPRSPPRPPADGRGRPRPNPHLPCRPRRQPPAKDPRRPWPGGGPGRARHRGPHRTGNRNRTGPGHRHHGPAGQRRPYAHANPLRTESAS